MNALMDLFPDARRVFFKKGDYLIHLGQQVDYIYYLAQGSVDRTMVNIRGIESYMSHKEAGQGVGSLVGVLFLYDENVPPYISDNDFVAATDCVCYRIPVEECRRQFFQHPQYLEDVARVAVHECGNMRAAFLSRTEAPAYVLMCRILLDSAQQTDQGLMVPKTLTNVVMASRISAHTVTVSRMLHMLRQESIVERTPNGLRILDARALEDLAQGRRKLGYH
jgi:CRP/FNR family cyclic AMP-dependent transcriptional regulator